MSETTYHSFSDLPPELPLAFRLKQLVKAAGKYAEDFGSQPSVTKILTAYAPEPGISSWFDPQTYWGIKHLKEWPDSVLLTHNWGNLSASEGSVRANVKYMDNCYNGKKEWGNRTYRHLFEDADRRLFDRTLIANALWGLLKTGKALDKVKGTQVYYAAAMHLWLPLLKLIKPKQVRVCGDWADASFITDTGDFVSFIGFLQSKAFQSKLPKRVEVTSHYHPYYNKEAWERQVKEWLKPSP
jgi:hypothetical protein